METVSNLDTVEQAGDIVCLVAQEEERIDFDDQLAICHGWMFYFSV